MSRLQENRRNPMIRAIALSAIGITVLSLSATGNPALAQGPVTRAFTNGPTARASAETPIGFFFMSVARAEARPQPAPQNPENLGTILQFFLFQNGNFFEGAGFIPNGDFKLVGQKLILNTDTSAIPGFDNGGLPGGVITIEWTPTNEFSQEFTGQMTTRFGNTVVNFSGRQSTTTASAKGSFFGASFDSGGEMGVNHNSTIVIERKK